MNFELMDFKSILEAIDKKYVELKGHCGRFDVRWGVFSTTMNRALRKRMEGLKPHDRDRDRFLWLHAYWICRSQLLDLHMKKSFVVGNKIKKMLKEAKSYRQFVLTGKGPEITEAELLGKLLRRK